MIGVPMSNIMASSAEGISTPTSAVLVGGVTPPPVGTPRPSAPTAPLSPSIWVVQPPTSLNVVGPSSGFVIGVPSAPFASPSFMHTSQSGHAGSSSFFQGFLWNGGHIP